MNNFLNNTKIKILRLDLLKKSIFVFLISFGLSGCSTSFNMPDWMDADLSRERAAERKAKKDGGPEGKIQDSIKLFGSDVRDTGATIGVNSLLWRASLDTISFMPLDEADPYGGVIMTEWYNNPNNLNERYKITIYILDTRLRADAVRVSLFMQQYKNGEWVNISTSDETRLQLENSILTKARQMKQE
ncbi:MAG: DUF3576 domain-containing protein [Pseudomonadota bacterium]|nr:DUF3576 domain-containing protein [Pseudomonadota bacterium]